MHTFNSAGVTVHHAGDASGDAIISDASGNQLTVPCAVLFKFVAEIVRSRRIARIEQLPAHAMLGLRKKDL